MTHGIHIDRQALLRRAAEMGPGHRGKRDPSDAVERSALATALSDDAPAYLHTEHTWIDRRAKLFEAGDYPDKGVSVTPEMLRALDTSFDLPVPVLIEHARSPLELGYLTSIEVVGDELFGNVALTAEADALLAKSGARSLSVGLSGDLTSIREVSVVSNPRVADARLFSGSLEPYRWQLAGEPCSLAAEPLPQPLSSATQPSPSQASRAQERGAEPYRWQLAGEPCSLAAEPLPQPLSSATQPSPSQASRAQERGAEPYRWRPAGTPELSSDRCEQAFAGETPTVRGDAGALTPCPLSHGSRRGEPDTEVFIARCIRDGRLVPAQAEFARLLLQSPGPITFGERSVSVAEIFERLIERQVPHRLFSELGREGVQDYSEHLLLPEEAEFYRKHFPEISLDDIAQRKRAHPTN